MIVSNMVFSALGAAKASKIWIDTVLKIAHLRATSYDLSQFLAKIAPRIKVGTATVAVKGSTLPSGVIL